MTRVGIYAGTFDPVHNGHIAFAKEALKTGMDRVIFLPERAPRGKSEVTDFNHRLAMLQVATREQPGLEVFQLPHEQFTVAQTLPELRKQFGDNLTLLIGSDVAATLANWEDIATLLKYMELLVAIRAPHTQTDVVTNLQRTVQTVRFVCIPSPAPHISSRAIRSDDTPDDHLHSGVRSYAGQHRLYDR